MYLESIRLVSFRAHRETRVELAPGVNLLFGANGAGKTNVLEAVHYACLTKGFLASSDAYVLRRGDPFFEVEAVFSGLKRSHSRVRLAYAKGDGKRIFLNGAPLERLSELVGQFPVVIAAPGDHVLTGDGPEVRRRFIDNVLSQSRPVYLDDLMQYRRALRQRNGLLLRYRKQAIPPGLLDSWDAELVELGSRVILGRLRFIRAFMQYLDEAHTLIEAVGERPELQYETIDDLEGVDSVAEVADRFRKQLALVSRREREQGRTFAGPHHDELVFRLNGMDVRRYASQGQHRLFALALRLAQYFYLKNQLGEEPILLLDDLFGSLDPRRTDIVLQLLRDGAVGQSLLTATSKAPFDHMIPFTGTPHRAFQVVSGTLRPVNEHPQPPVPPAP